MNSAGELLSARSGYQKWVPVLDLAIREVFELMLGSRLDASGDDAQDHHGITAMVGLAGQICGVLSIRCHPKAATRMAFKMLGVEPSPGSREIQDAFGEICNMVAGNFKNKIAGMGDKCMLSVPTVITGSDYTLRSLADTDTIEITLVFERQPFTVSLEIHS
jgi:chemotaxis protein CheX